jgi:acetyltransferase-like isoleucine patch superfamily enzyme
MLGRRIREWWSPPSEAERARRKLEQRFAGVSFGTDIQIIGLDSLEIGKGSCVSDHVWINDCVRDGSKRLVLGKYVLIGRSSMISTAGRLEIADFCLLGPGVYVSDADHVFEDPFQPFIQQGATMGRAVTVEENCWIGMHAKIFGNLTVGRGSVIAGGASVRESVPPFSVVVGSPSRIVKMYDFEARAWVATRDETEIAEILRRRESTPAPDRAAYRQTLQQNYRVGDLDPLLAGASQSI